MFRFLPLALLFARADHYRLSAGKGHLLVFERTITGPPEFTFESDIPPGTHVRWIVTALRTATPYDEVLARLEAVQVFTIAE